MLGFRRLAKIFGAVTLFSYTLYHFRFTPKPKSIEELKEIIERLNTEQTIHNYDKYGPVKNDTIIIGIQVHDRLLYLEWVIKSLSKARDIDKALLIFSHDWYDEEINALVRSIQFAMVLQIFYPHSVQLHPMGYPGPDPFYCEDDDLSKYYIIRSNRSSKRCYIPAVQDRYADLVQIKHHWWWKANSIFSRLECTVNHTGLVVFLEDDHYVLEDFVHILRLLRATADSECPQCDLMALGTLTWNYVMRYDSAKLEVRSWMQTLQNMGITMNRTFWNEIVRMQKAFCRYNDYNWDMSLLHMSIMRLKKGPFKVLTVKAPRVFHIGKCGVHFHKTNCKDVELLNIVRKMTRACRKKLFPANLTIVNVEDPPRMRKREAGGWKDRRDRELCRNMTKMQRLNANEIQ